MDRKQVIVFLAIAFLVVTIMGFVALLPVGTPTESSTATVRIVMKGFGDHSGFFMDGEDVRTGEVTRYYFSMEDAGQYFKSEGSPDPENTNLHTGDICRITITRDYYNPYPEYNPHFRNSPFDYYEWRVVSLSKIQSRVSA